MVSLRAALEPLRAVVRGGFVRCGVRRPLVPVGAATCSPGSVSARLLLGLGLLWLAPGRRHL